MASGCCPSLLTVNGIVRSNMADPSTVAQLREILGPLLTDTSGTKHSWTGGEASASNPKKTRLTRPDSARPRPTERAQSSTDELVDLLAKLVLRHEDALHTLAIDCGFVLFVDLKATEGIAHQFIYGLCSLEGGLQHQWIVSHHYSSEVGPGAASSSNYPQEPKSTCRRSHSGDDRQRQGQIRDYRASQRHLPASCRVQGTRVS